MSGQASDIDAAVALLNLHRAAAASPPVTLDALASSGARQHVLYMLRHGTGGHYEDPSQPDYTPAGDEAARTSSLSLSGSSAVACVQGLLGVPYHRFYLLEPGTRTVRLAFQAGACVLGVVASTARAFAPTVAAPLVYPADGETNLPLMWSGGESPDPRQLCGPAYTTANVGYPITVEFQSYSTGIKVEAKSLTDDAGHEVDSCLINAEVPNPEVLANLAPGSALFGWPGKLIVLSQSLLQPATRYTMHLSGTYGGVPFDIRSSFTTMAVTLFTGTVPSPGTMGFVLTGEDPRLEAPGFSGVEVQSLVDAFVQAGCNVKSLWLTRRGRFDAYIPGAPWRVNLGFADYARFAPDQAELLLVKPQTPVLVVCH